ncbi:hypothetical protein O181_000975 [Austropuccinia psidii MF-1]|uniref:Uncharacterized protein n=1 Tax=Austropuccinia psidii MF-1 TaxID=1389203 RepID=A0A9Q3GBD6_9BASI|nr:hypothetical protein [Austropuccinia psidii MF-1]
MFFSQPSTLIKQLLLQTEQKFIIQTSTDPRIQEQSVSKKCLIIPDSPPCQILSLAKALYEDPPQESSLVLNLESTTSHQPIQSPQTTPIDLPLVPLIKSGSLLPKNPSSLTHQNSPTPTLSFAFEFENPPEISQTSSLTLPQFKHLPIGAPQQEYPNHPSLPNVYVPKSKGTPYQASSNIPLVPQSPPESK